MSASYNFTQPWLLHNVIVMTVPKANILYNTGASNPPVSLINSSNLILATISIDGQTVSIDTTKSFVTVGTGFNVDTAVWSLTSGGITTSAGNKPLVVSFPVTLPTMITTVLTGFTL